MLVKNFYGKGTFSASFSKRDLFVENGPYMRGYFVLPTKGVDFFEKSLKEGGKKSPLCWT
jgi:hypothetical protein